MATCRDCIHYDVCHNNFKNIDMNKEMTDKHCCVYFKDKSRIIELPCKVGNLVFEPYRDFINVYEITTIRLSKYGLFFNWRLYNSGVYSNVNGFSEREINKTIFLTKEEAEAKLKELNGNEKRRSCDY